MKKPASAEDRDKTFENAFALRNRLITRQDYEEAAVLRDLEHLAKWLAEREAALVDALVWCGGSPSFAEGGSARKGWMEMVAPLLKKESP